MYNFKCSPEMAKILRDKIQSDGIYLFPEAHCRVHFLKSLTEVIIVLT